MFEGCVAPEALSVLKGMVQREIVRRFEFYLAGGTGLALQLGHRISEDLGFFTPRRFQPRELVGALAGKFDVQILGMADGTLHALFFGKARVSFLLYPHGLMFPVREFHGCPVADPRDIGAAKIMAIGQRGAKKDFVDLYYLLQRFSLEELKEVVDQKYTGVRYSWVHLARSLGYFEEADRDPMPVMTASGRKRGLTPAEWAKIKGFFVQLQKSILAALSHENA